MVETWPRGFCRCTLARDALTCALANSFSCADDVIKILKRSQSQFGTSMAQTFVFILDNQGCETVLSMEDDWMSRLVVFL